MSGACWICLAALEDEARYHPRCLKALFGVPRAPRIDLEVANLHTAGLAMAGHTSISGVQRKISAGLTADRATLRVEVERGRYILKPAAETFPHLPESEHLTMRLAALAGIEVPPCGLVRLADDSVAYIVRRIDRTPEGRKLRLEDFCQLAGKAPKEKYVGSAELCARLVRRFATEPLIEVLKLYRVLLFGWWTGNGDLHLKNLSLLTGDDGRHRLSPAYDLLSTRLVIPGDPLALPVGGKKEGLGRETWLHFAGHCGLPPRAADRVRAEIVDALPGALALVEASPLPEEMRAAYAGLLRERAGVLEGDG